MSVSYTHLDVYKRQPEMPYKEIINAVKPRVEETDAVKEIWLIINGTVKKITRKDIIGK